MIKTFAALVIHQNVDDIVAEAAEWNLNVDYLSDTMADNAHMGFATYAILSINQESNHATFTEMAHPDFLNTWERFQGSTHGPHFKEVCLKASAR